MNTVFFDRKSKKSVADRTFYAGCFDPFTNGHLDVLKQALERFDKVILGLGINDKKKRYFDRTKMIAAIEKVLKQHNIQDMVLCLAYDHYTGETALKNNCSCLIRGIKHAGEFTYELNLANYNRQHYNINTLFFLPSRPELEGISSTLAREFYDAGDFGSLEKILPTQIFELLNS
jgi:pantetheine-phosphate adenylyltransferase